MAGRYDSIDSQDRGSSLAGCVAHSPERDESVGGGSIHVSHVLVRRGAAVLEDALLERGIHRFTDQGAMSYLSFGCSGRRLESYS